eukprot:m.31169 g.31169  ORF g.31169 m.31169 type:complete len:540 (+) comp16409_c0_seq1:109-1728(+)
MDKVLILLVIVGDHEKNGHYAESSRPLWLATALAYNHDHARRYNHKLLVEQVDAPPFFPWQTKRCDAMQDANQKKNCYGGYHRENCTWYKFRSLLEKLNAAVAEFVLFIDVDSVIYTRPDEDIVTEMIELLNREGKDILVADEDWRDGGAGATNTGVILAKNTEWSKMWWRQMINMQETQVCGTNEQACFRNYLAKNKFDSKEHIIVASGSLWNRHPRIGVHNDSSKIVHFMGGAKSGLDQIDVPSVGVCGDKHLCHDVMFCASRTVIPAAPGRDPKYKPPQKIAFVTMLDLHRAVGSRLHNIKEMKVLLSEAKRLNADAVMLLPKDDVALHPLTSGERSVLEKHGFKIEMVDWIIPPGIHNSLPTSECTHQSYLVLHALGLSYDAIVVVDLDVLIVGDVEPLFRCATQNRFLATSGVRQPLAQGLFAFKPSKQLFGAAVHFATTLELPSDAVWDPSSTSFLREECGIGLLWSLLYSTNDIIKQVSEAAMTKASAAPPTALLMDRCTWKWEQGDTHRCSEFNRSCSTSHTHSLRDTACT